MSFSERLIAIEMSIFILSLNRDGQLWVNWKILSENFFFLLIFTQEIRTIFYPQNAFYSVIFYEKLISRDVKTVFWEQSESYMKEIMKKLTVKQSSTRLMSLQCQCQEIFEVRSYQNLRRTCPVLKVNFSLFLCIE